MSRRVRGSGVVRVDKIGWKERREVLEELGCLDESANTGGDSNDERLLEAFGDGGSTILLKEDLVRHELEV